MTARGLALKSKELIMVSYEILEQIQPAWVRVMTARLRLPNRRECESREFRHAGHPFTLTAGHYPDNRIGEIFISSNRAGSQVEAVARDSAIAVSIALQFGVPIETICGALTKDHDGGPATLLGAALDAIAGAAP